MRRVLSDTDTREIGHGTTRRSSPSRSGFGEYRSGRARPRDVRIGDGVRQLRAVPCACRPEGFSINLALREAWRNHASSERRVSAVCDLPMISLHQALLLIFASSIVEFVTAKARLLQDPTEFNKEAANDSTRIT